jgi:hypothetical protein
MKNITTTNAPVDTQTAHTPGPWKVMPCPVHGGRHPLHDQRWIATAETQIEFGATPEDWRCETGSLICEMRDGEPANARLIAASPCLLSALERLANAVDSHCRAITTAALIELDDAAINARAAIAIATGGAK